MPADKTFADIVVGDSAEFEEMVSEELILQFAKLSGDHNPLHTKRHVAHGMLGGALLSRLVGMHLPGLRALYLSQSLAFKAPIAAGSRVVVRGEVVQKMDALKILTIRTTITERDSGTVLTSGEARVRVVD